MVAPTLLIHTLYHFSIGTLFLAAPQVAFESLIPLTEAFVRALGGALLSVGILSLLVLVKRYNGELLAVGCYTLMVFHVFACLTHAFHLDLGHGMTFVAIHSVFAILLLAVTRKNRLSVL